MKIIVMGGDGFCGWPTTLHLAKKGHQVLIIDSLARRGIDEKLGTNSLTPITDIYTRIKVASKLITKIDFVNIDIASEYEKLKLTIKKFEPEAIIHFAEQRSAPYSMKNEQTRNYTINNNITATHNICSAIVEINKDISLIHLGTMGVYGYNDRFGKIPEGYLDIKVLETNKRSKIIYPSDPGSIYHLTKVLDHDILQYYNKNWGINITDLHQGVVWGTETPETKLDNRLCNRFDYCGDYGTVVNRFLMQAEIGYPLTIYGTGGQTRAMIHIEDTVKCIEIAINNKDINKDIKIYNQISETINLKRLANTIKDITNCQIQYIPNPRNELSDNALEVSNEGLLSLGFEPILLKNSLCDEICNVVSRYKNRVNLETIMPSSYWK